MNENGFGRGGGGGAAAGPGAGPGAGARRVVFAVFPGFQLLDLTGPHEVFTQVAARLPTGGADAAGGLAVETVAAGAGPVRSSGGLAVVPTGTTAQCGAGPVDTLVAVGGPGVHDACLDREFVDWFARTAGRARRVASVCSGAFLLAAAGLLDGRRATTHWGSCERLARQYPRVTVDPEPIFVRDGEVWTSAGVTAGLDLALALAEADHGPELARAVARHLVMFVQRPGSQAQFSNQLTAQRPSREPLRELLDWVGDHLDADLSVPALAARALMSERHFARVFHAETGRTPAAYVEAARLEAARRLLETGREPLRTVARRCGYGTVETLHRSFRRAVGTTPDQYRRRFTSTSPTSTALTSTARPS